MHLRFLVFDFGSSSCGSPILHHRRPPCCRPLRLTSLPSVLTEGGLAVSQIENCKPLVIRRTDLGAPIIPQERLQIGFQKRLSMLEVFSCGVGISELWINNVSFTIVNDTKHYQNKILK